MAITSQQIIGHVRFALVLCFWGFGVSFFGIAPMLVKRISPGIQDIDYEHNETLLGSGMVLRNHTDAPLELFLEYIFEEGNFGLTAPVLLVWPLLWVFYVNMGVLKSFLFAIVQCAAFVCYIGVFYMGTFNQENNSQMSLVGTLICFVSPVLLLRFSLPWQNQLWWYALQNMLVITFGIVVALAVLKMTSQFGNLFILLILVPISRLITGSTTRHIAAKLMMDGDVGAGAVDVRRDYAWSFLLVPQMLFATFSRMIVTKIQDSTSYLLFLLCNMLQEVFMRGTIPKQDKAASAAIKLRISINRVGPHRRSSVVSPVNMRSIDMSEASNKGGLSQVTKEWYAVVLVGEMVSEYVGIFANLGLLLMFHDAILVQPFPAFSIEEKPFDEPMPVQNWILSALIQCASEIVVDVLCSIYEDMMYDFPVKTFWDTKPFRTKFTNLLLGASVGICASMLVTFLGIKYFDKDTCPTTNICSCEPLPGTLYGTYCLRLYPETNGTYPLT